MEGDQGGTLRIASNVHLNFVLIEGDDEHYTDADCYPHRLQQQDAQLARSLGFRVCAQLWQLKT